MRHHSLKKNLKKTLKNVKSAINLNSNSKAKKMTQNTLAQNMLKLDKQVPRYTSYPTAPHFSDAVRPQEMEIALASLPDDRPVSLYFHIPFCHEMCFYCGCNTKITKRYAPVESYTHILLKEINMVADAIGRTLDVSHIHFGGGSPNSLNPDDFLGIMNLVRSRFNVLESAEIAVELDPRVLTHDKAEGLAKGGVNRGSLGVQDFNEKVQKTINRIQPYEVVKQSIDWLRGFGIENLNTDLIYGLPYQTVDGILENIDKTLTLDPARISLFGYAHVPWMKKHMRLIPEEALPQAAERLEMFTKATAKLLAEGYVAIGLDHFVKQDDAMAIALKNGTLNRNFQGYTTDNAESLIGMGCSAISNLPTGYYQNDPKVHKYEKLVQESGLATHRGVEFSGDDVLRKAAIEAIMCELELDTAALLKKFNKPNNYFDKELTGLEALVDDGIITIENKYIRVVPEANAAVRVVASFFDEYFNPQTNTKYSKAI
jgi:oxygen-independent coproporphyrinogen-3 oxidase